MLSMTDSECGKGRMAVTGLLHILVIVILWGIAIWDISGILNQYTNDNRYTLVRTVPINGTDAPFYENAEVCVAYDNTTSIFDLVWWNDAEVKQAQNVVNGEHWVEMVTALSNISNIDFDQNDTVIKLSKRQLVYAMKIVEIVNIADLCFSPSNSCVVYFDCSQANRIPLKMILDRLSIGTLDLIVRKWLDQHTWRDSEYLTSKGTEITPQVICNRIQVRNVIKLPDHYNFLSVGILHDSNQGDQAYLNSEISFVKVRFRLKYHKISLIQPGQYAMINVQISNVGMYDKSEVTPNCVEPNRVPQMEDDWKLDAFVSKMEENCGCVPYTFINRISSNKSIPIGTVPFCNEDAYISNCTHEAFNFALDTKCAERCRTTKNQYDVTWKVSHGDMPTVPDGRRSRINLAFLLMDDTYSIYEEKVRMSFEQLVAQVGGDIGLYTGFSMLALWEFILYAYARYKAQHKKQLTESAAPSAKLAAASWFHTALSLMRKTGQEKDQEEISYEIQMLKEKLEKTMMAVKQSQMAVHLATPEEFGGTVKTRCAWMQ